MPRFDDKIVTAIIDDDEDRYRVTVPLPEKPISVEIHETQQYVISVKAISDYPFKGHTLLLPFLPDLNEFFRRKISLGSDSIRVGRDRIGFFENHGGQSSINLYPLKKQDLLFKLFERAKLKVEFSAAGQLANLILQKMGELEDCRVFQIKGVREIIGSASRTIGWSNASRVIHEREFEKFKDLFIEPRNEPTMSPSDVIQFLLKKRVLLPKQKNVYRLWSFFQKVSFSCTNCGNEMFLRPSEFIGFKECGICEQKFFMPLFISKKLNNSKKYWELERNGVFKRGTKQEGCVPVLLTIMQLNRLLGHGSELPWVPSVILKTQNAKELNCEADFAILDSNSRFEGTEESRIQIAIGECKTNGEITDVDISNLCKVRDKLEESGITCYLVFSKTSDSFLPAEIERFKKLEKEKGTSPILFTNMELEPYMPYWGHPMEKSLPCKHPMSFQELSFNSKAIYLR